MSKVGPPASQTCCTKSSAAGTELVTASLHPPPPLKICDKIQKKSALWGSNSELKDCNRYPELSTSGSGKAVQLQLFVLICSCPPGLTKAEPLPVELLCGHPPWTSILLSLIFNHMRHLKLLFPPYLIFLLVFPHPARYRGLRNADERNYNSTASVNS